MLTQFDKDLLNILQTDLPLSSRPFAVLAGRLGVSEEKVIERLHYLKGEGLIRRIGPFFDSNQLGYTSALVAVQVRSECVASVAEAINAYPGVTHNYERENEDGAEFNLWFAILSPSITAQDKILTEIKSLPGIEQMIILPATQKYKVSVQFKL